MIKKIKYFLLTFVTLGFLQLESSAMEIEEADNNTTHITHSIPVGSVLPFAGAKEPDGWLMCDGRIVSCSQYRNLYAVIGRTYTSPIIGSTVPLGEDLFCVPDMRGRVPVGVDSDSRTNFVTSNRVMLNNTLGASGGEENHQLTVAEMPSHNHHGLAPDSALNGIGFMRNGEYGTCKGPQLCNDVGGNQPHNNMQPYLILNYIIKY